MTERGEDHHRVHFPVEVDQFGNDNEITVHPGGPDTVNVHLGFLRFHHYYEIAFSVPFCHSEVTLVELLGQVPNKNCQLLEFTHNPDKQTVDINLKFFAHKEKLLKETVVLCDANDESKTLKLVLQARVLGKGKGTPLLKDGIKCTGFEIDEESEASDWQGFS